MMNRPHCYAFEAWHPITILSSTEIGPLKSQIICWRRMIPIGTPISSLQDCNRGDRPARAAFPVQGCTPTSISPRTSWEDYPLGTWPIPDHSAGTVL